MKCLAVLASLGLGVAGLLAGSDVSAQTITAYQYDAHGRLLSASENGGPNSGMTSSYAYDDATNRTGREIGNPFAQLWMATALSHITGAADGNTWVGRPGMSAGYLTYGTNVTTIPAGARTAVYRIMVDQVDSSTSTIVAVDVYDASAAQFILQLNVSPQYLSSKGASPYVWYDLELPFTYDASRLGHTIEIRTWYGGYGTVWVEKVGYR